MTDEKITTEEEAFAVIREDGPKLGYVLEGLRTLELCIESVMNLDWDRVDIPETLLEHVPEKLRDEVCAKYSEEKIAFIYTNSVLIAGAFDMDIDGGANAQLQVDGGENG